MNPYHDYLRDRLALVMHDPAFLDDGDPVGQREAALEAAQLVGALIMSGATPWPHAIPVKHALYALELVRDRANFFRIPKTLDPQTAAEVLETYWELTAALIGATISIADHYDGQWTPLTQGEAHRALAALHAKLAPHRPIPSASRVGCADGPEVPYPVAETFLEVNHARQGGVEQPRCARVRWPIRRIPGRRKHTQRHGRGDHRQ